VLCTQADACGDLSASRRPIPGDRPQSKETEIFHVEDSRARAKAERWPCSLLPIFHVKDVSHFGIPGRVTCGNYRASSTWKMHAGTDMAIIRATAHRLVVQSRVEIGTQHFRWKTQTTIILFTVARRYGMQYAIFHVEDVNQLAHNTPRRPRS
jgi:hypothetical protein